MLDDNPMRFSGGIHKLTHFIYNIAQIKPCEGKTLKNTNNLFIACRARVQTTR